MRRSPRSRSPQGIANVMLAIGAACVLANATVGCRSDQELPSGRSFQRIALVGVGKSHRTWPVLQATARNIARVRSRLTIDVMAPDTPSPTAQQEILKGLLESRPDAICVHPTDSAALDEAIAAMVAQGVSVVTLGSDTPSHRRSGFSGPYESDIGRAAALACEKLVRGRSSSIMLLHGGAQDAVTGGRYAAFKASLALARGVFLMKEVNCGGSRVDAVEIVRSEAGKYPRVAGWTFLGDWALRGMSEQERLLPAGCGILLCEADPTYLEYLRDGRIEGLMVYDYREAVQQALFAAIRIAEDTKGRGMGHEISVAPEVIWNADYAAWEERWQAWARGEPTPKARPQATEPGSKGAGLEGMKPND